MIEEKNECLHPLMKLSENYLEMLCKISDPEFKEAREELEKIYTRGQNLIYNSKDYKEMTKAFVSSSYELVMAYRAATSPKPTKAKAKAKAKTEPEYFDWSNYFPAKVAYTSLESFGSNNMIFEEPKAYYYPTIQDSLNTEHNVDVNQFAKNLFNLKPAEVEVQERLTFSNKDALDHYKNKVYNNIKKVEI